MILRGRISFLMCAMALVVPMAFAMSVRGEGETMTMTFHNVTQTFPVTAGPCPGPAGGIVTFTYNGVEHITNDSSGGAHFTFTSTGDFTFVGGTFVDGTFVPSGLVATGQATMWGGGNLPASGSAVFTFTFSLQGTISDGTIFRMNSVAHVTVNANGTMTTMFAMAVCH